MLGFLKEKLRMSVYKAIIVQHVGTTQKTEIVTYELDDVTKKPKKVTTQLEVPISVPRYRVLKVKYVDPNKPFFKHRVGSILSRSSVTKFLPIDFSYEAYYSNEKHVSFIDWDTGRSVLVGGGEVVFANPPELEATKNNLVRTASALQRGKTDLLMTVMALGLGVFLGMFIQGTLIPMAG